MSAPGRHEPGGLWTLSPGDSGYPEQLGDLDESDGPVLRGFGREDAVAELGRDSAVTIVGSRRASSYGLRVAETLAGDLARVGVTVVSGLAIGIDGAAHRGAVDAAGRTIAVLAGGPDVIYPARHRALYQRILVDGAIISDQALGTVPRKQSFPARNRIMAALAKVVVVVEAAERSGSLVTANLAQDLGRELAAVPGQVGMRMASGTNLRIKEGAALVRDAQDVLDLLAGVGVVDLRRAAPVLEPALACVLESVERGASTPDRIALAAGLDARTTALALARLELLGYLVRDGLGLYAPTGLIRSGDP